MSSGVGTPTKSLRPANLNPDDLVNGCSETLRGINDPERKKLGFVVRMVSDPGDASPWWIALSKCVTLINSSHNELLQVVWDYDWDRSDADVRAYSEVGLLSHGSKTIVFSNSKYLTSSRQNQKNPFGPMASSEMQVPYGQIEDFQPQCFPLENHPWNKKLHSPPYSRNFKLQFLNLISHDQSRKTLLGPELNYCG